MTSLLASLTTAAIGFASAQGAIAPLIAAMPAPSPQPLVQPASLWQTLRENFPVLVEDPFTRSNAQQTCSWWRMLNQSEGTSYHRYLATAYQSNEALQDFGAYDDYLKLHDQIQARFCPDVF